ncbi:MAG: ABC transporter substrate-binding protein [Promethearchaeota archaeon]|jgi:branched-chain amino acid transport system substrate-binding protein
METKRIIAIVVIVAAIAGIGFGAWYFLLAPGAGVYQWSAADCPGNVPSDISASQIIKVGVCSDTERIQGEGSENGATLAAMEINNAGGILVNGTTYYIGITSENTDEANPVLDTAVAVSAAKKLINFKKVQYATGGFRTEAGLAYQDLWMEKKIIFFNVGAATTSLSAKVLSDYATYKYFFQPSPMNSTALAIELISLIISTAAFQTMVGGHNVTRFSFLREDYAWTAGFAGLMIGALQSNPSFNLTFTGANIAFAPDATALQMEAHWNTIQGNNTQIVIPLISGPIGLTYMNSYASVQPNCIPIGINVVAQDANFWADSSGDAEFGVTLESVFETNKTSMTLPFWYNYIGNFSTSPIYTATGAYDAVNQLAWAIEATQSFDPDTLVTQLETLKPGAGLVGAGGIAAYDASHTPWYGYPYGIGLAIQWYNGTKILVPAPGIYPSGVYEPALMNMSPLALPSWGLYYYD